MALSILLAADPSAREVLEAALPADPDDLASENRARELVYEGANDVLAQKMKQWRDRLGSGVTCIQLRLISEHKLLEKCIHWIFCFKMNPGVKIITAFKPTIILICMYRILLR